MSLIVVDNFYENPDSVRDFALTREYLVRGNYPGLRTLSYATVELKNKFQSFVKPFGEISCFSTEPEAYNGAFQFATQEERSWIHQDETTDWGGIIYLTPDAPLSSGTAFYEPKTPMTFEEGNSWGRDMTKWNLVDQVANKYNRLILFNSKRWHMSMDYFGKGIQDGRLFQVFFFSTQNQEHPMPL